MTIGEKSQNLDILCKDRTCLGKRGCIVTVIICIGWCNVSVEVSWPVRNIYGQMCDRIGVTKKMNFKPWVVLMNAV